MGHPLTRRGFAGATLAMTALAAGGSVRAQQLADDLNVVDPQLRGPLARPEQIKIPSMTEQDVVAFRRKAPPPGPPFLTAPPVTTRQIRGPLGADTLRVFLINAPGKAGRPAILHIHGGGYILGSPTTEIPNLQRIAAAQDCVIVSVDYRLAPETRFPGALEDNYAALEWLHENAEALGVDRRRVIVMGESAGGGHAAALAIAARDRGQFKLAGQVLVYPMLDDRTGSVHQPPPDQGRYVWTPEQNRLGWGALLGVPAGSPNPPQGSVPARVEDLSGLPPTFIAVGGLDLFLQEDIDYARRLLDSGVPTELLVVPGAYHAFPFIVPGAQVSRRFLASIDAAITRLLAPPTP
uniref:Alpha/beta hydrolase fold-3 domain protein n=1 Tax=Caulobacter sp. (strain K31) TaxID=366602 RepID=B0SW96_CAUSK